MTEEAASEGPGGPARRIGIGYLGLSVVVVAYGVVQTAREPWVGDFWEHAAVVRELATHPGAPVHPLLGIDAPEAFTSPYSLLVAGISRLGGIDCVRALGIAGILNLLLLLIGLRLFVEILAPERGARVSFYLLLFALLLWGKAPWVYSGFFNLGSLGFVLPYASTFAAGLALVTLFVWERGLRTHAIGAAVFAGVAAATILVTHPPTVMFLAAGLAAVTLNPRNGPGVWVALGLVLAAGFGLALLWPFYPVWKLIASGQATFHESNKFMYQRVLARTYPALLAVPFILWNVKSNWRQPILVMAVGLGVVYVFGALSKQWNYGRTIPFLVLLCHAQLAIVLAAAEERWAGSRTGGRVARVVSPIIVAAGCVLLSYEWQIGPAIETLRTARSVRDDLGFLTDRVGQYDVVLTDLDSGWYVPAFGGKVAASRRPIAFVPGHDQRVADVRAFHDPTADRTVRDAIIRKYRARFVLIDKAPRGWKPPDRGELVALGRTVGESERYLLVEVGP